MRAFYISLQTTLFYLWSLCYAQYMPMIFIRMPSCKFMFKHELSIGCFFIYIVFYRCILRYGYNLCRCCACNRQMDRLTDVMQSVLGPPSIVSIQCIKYQSAFLVVYMRSTSYCQMCQLCGKWNITDENSEISIEISVDSKMSAQNLAIDI